MCFGNHSPYIHQTTWNHFPEDLHCQQQCCESLRSHWLVMLHLFCNVYLEWMCWIFLFVSTIMWCAMCSVIIYCVSLCLLWYSYTTHTCVCSVCRLLLCIHPLSSSASWVDSGESALYFIELRYTNAYMTKYNTV